MSAKTRRFRRRAAWFLFSCGSAAVSVLAASDAAEIANATAPIESVEGRQRPEYDPIGVSLADLLGYQDREVDPRTGLRLTPGPVDSFLLFPKAGLQAGYNDNLLKTQNNVVGDWIYNINPSLKLQSDWDNHDLFVLADFNIGRYASQTNEDYDDIKLTAGGRLDLTEFENIAVTLTRNYLHEERGTFDRNFGSRPTEYVTTGGTLVWNYLRDALLLRTTAEVSLLDFEDTDAAAFSDLNQDDRDRWEYTLTPRIGYEFYEDTTFYLEPQISYRRYVSTPDDFGFNRDSRGYQMLVGLTYDASSITYLDAAIGYMRRDYADALLPPAQGLAARLSMTWNVTDLHTITTDVRRDITEAIDQNVGGQIDTSIGARIDYEYLYNTIFFGSARYTVSTKDGAGATSSNRDVTWLYQLGMRHLINEYAALKLGWNMNTRTSNLPGSDYEQNLWFLRLELYI